MNDNKALMKDLFRCHKATDAAIKEIKDETTIDRYNDLIIERNDSIISKKKGIEKIDFDLLYEQSEKNYSNERPNPGVHTRWKSMLIPCWEWCKAHDIQMH